MLEKITDEIEKIVIHSDEKNIAEVNCYLVNGKNGVTLIDAGDYSEHGKKIWENVLNKGIIIEKIILTHTHQDHIGLARWLQETKGIPVYVSEIGLTEMKKYTESDFKQKFNEFIQKYGYTKKQAVYQDKPGIYDFEPAGYYSTEGTIRIGDDLYEVIWTPGHAPDHFCFYQQEKKILFTGDHIIDNVSPVIGLWTAEESNVLKDYFRSLELIRQYPTEIALAGHGATFYNLEDQVDDIRGKHLHRLEQLMALTSKDPKTAEEVCEAIYGPVEAIGPFMAVLTRLLYLEAEGKLERKEMNGKVYFQAV